MHARGSLKTWDSLPPSKRKKAPLVSGILPPRPELGQMVAPDSGEEEGHGRESQTGHIHGHLASCGHVQANPAVRNFLWGRVSLLGSLDSGE